MCKFLTTISKEKGLTKAIDRACMHEVSIVNDDGSLSGNSVGLKANEKIWVRWLMSMFQEDYPQRTMTTLTRRRKCPQSLA
jgi:hypothetical protein